MNLYDKKNNMLDTENYHKYNPIIKGSSSNLYINQNKILKIYNSDASLKQIMPISTFKKLKNLNLDNMVKLYDYYFIYTDFLNKLSMDAYTMEYISRDGTMLINSQKEYLLEMTNKLQILAKKLSENHIVMFDCHFGNIIFNQNDVIIIDQDHFYTNNFLSTKKIYLKNLQEVLYAIKSTMKNELKSICEYEAMQSSYLKLMPIKLEKDSDLLTIFDEIFIEDTPYKTFKKKTGK